MLKQHVGVGAFYQNQNYSTPHVIKHLRWYGNNNNSSYNNNRTNKGHDRNAGVRTVTPQQKVLGSIHGLTKDAFLCGVCTFSLCTCGFSPGARVSSPRPKTWGLVQLASLANNLLTTTNKECVCCSLASLNPLSQLLGKMWTDNRGILKTFSKPGSQLQTKSYLRLKYKQTPGEPGTVWRKSTMAVQKKRM